MAAKRGKPAKKVQKKSIDTKPVKVHSQKMEKKALWWEKYSHSRGKSIRWFLLFIVIVYVVITYKGLVVAAMVNGQPISRFTVIKKLEENSGSAVLENEINELLIRQKAKDAHVTVTQDDIDAKITDIETNILGEGQNIDDVLALQGMTREDLEKQLEVQVMVERLLEGDVSVTDDELNQYLELNKDMVSDDFTEDDLKNYAREQLRQQKLSQRFSTWIQELRDDANINYYVKY